MTKLAELKIVKDEVIKNFPFKKILIYADYNCTTGFGVVAENIINNWRQKKDVAITILAINDFSQKAYRKFNNVEVIPCLPNEKHDPFARLKFLKMLYHGDFDFVFCLNDVEILNQLSPHIKDIKERHKKANKISFKICGYFPIDSSINPSDVDAIHCFDALVTYTNYGKKIVLEANKSIKFIDTVGHGASNDFFALNKENKSFIDFKKKMFGSSLVIGSVNRNQVRKDVGCILLAFYKLKEQKPELDVKLYLHMNPKDAMGVNLFRAASRLGLIVDKDIILPSSFNENAGVSSKKLNMIYNCFDVFVTTTTAEGWGLTISEAMLAKIPVIAPVHTAISEITKNGKLVFPLTDLREMIFVADYEKVRYVSCPNEVCARIIEVLEKTQSLNAKEKKKLNKKLYDAEKQIKSLSWDAVAEKLYANLIK